MELNERVFLQRLKDIHYKLYCACMKKLMFRPPEFPISKEEWIELLQVVDNCQKDLRDLLELAEEDLFTEAVKIIIDAIRPNIPPNWVPPSFHEYGSSSPVAASAPTFTREKKPEEAPPVKPEG